MSEIKVIKGEKFEITHISPCEGCHFHKPHLDGECAMPEEIELECGFDTVYKKNENATS